MGNGPGFKLGCSGGLLLSGPTMALSTGALWGHYAYLLRQLSIHVAPNFKECASSRQLVSCISVQFNAIHRQGLLQKCCQNPTWCSARSLLHPILRILGPSMGRLTRPYDMAMSWSNATQHCMKLQIALYNPQVWANHTPEHRQVKSLVSKM